jgi:hypothetical protein
MDPDSDPVADPDPSIFIIDLKMPTKNLFKKKFFCILLLEGTVNSGNFVSFQTLIGFFLKKSFWYSRPFFFSVDGQNRGVGSGSL